jgi:DNA-binding NtrC family response regulator
MPPLARGEWAVIDISEDPTMRPVIRLVLKAAVCHANVLLVGESGVGKAFIARKIHEASPMASGDFTTLFCMPDDDGRMERDTLVDRLRSLEDDLATIYVRDIDLLGLRGQRKLLTYLDDRERRIKTGQSLENAFARLVFSSQKDLLLESISGRYMRQLYLRTSVITIEVPPLRRREADIVSLARHFLILYSHLERKAIRGLSYDAEYLLRRLSWEGNIHELKNTMNRAVVFADEGQVLSAGMLEGVIQEAVG